MADIDPNLIFQEPPAETPDLRFGFVNQAAPNDANLVFQDSPLTSPDLVFGGGSFTAPRRRVSIAATVRGEVKVKALGSQPVKTYAAVLVGGVNVSAGVYYDNRVTPYLDARFMTGQQAAISRTSDNGGDWGVSKSSERQAEPAWQPAKFGSLEQGESTKASLPMEREFDVLHTLGDGRTATTSTRTEIAKFVDTARSSKYTTADPLRAISASGMQAGIFKVQSRGQDWQGGVPRQTIKGGSIGKGIANQGHNGLQSGWILAGRGKAGVSKPPEPPKPPIPIKLPEVVTSHLLFQHPPITGIPTLIFGGLSGSVIPVTNTKIVPVRRVYIVINNASLRRVDGNIQLPVLGMSLSLDTDSWTWGFNASLAGTALSSIEPGNNNTPVEVEALINGVAYRALIERVSRSREFGKTDIKVQGRGKSALLDSPYAPSLNFNNEADRTAQQLMNDALTYNGASIGWSVDWGITDWLVPAGVFAHQGSYVGALNKIANAAGAYIQPSPVAQTVRVLPRYKAAPWEWDTITPDFELPADLTTTENTEWLWKPKYERVYVSGIENGVFAQVTKRGGTGALLAPMVTDELMTDVAAARQRGIAVLSDTGRIANITIKVPVLQETGIITPGKFIRYVDGGTTRIGVVRSVGVDVSMPEIYQTLGVESHVI
jgi:hypothetical protein